MFIHNKPLSLWLPPSLFLSHYREALKPAAAAKKKKKSEHDPVRDSQPPRLHFRTSHEYKRTVPCSTAAMETPC